MVVAVRRKNRTGPSPTTKRPRNPPQQHRKGKEMPAMYDWKPAPVFAGMLCDVCSETDVGTSDFVLKYAFGYGSPVDGKSVTAAICDECLLRLIREHVPGAQFDDGNVL